MIGVKEAVSIALDNLSDFYSTAKDQFKDILLEEVELSDDKKYWRITIGFTRPVEAANILDVALRSKSYERDYKTFEIEADSGTVRSMKIRKV
ncbi:MAG: hypothetical protein AB1757_25550 [Acidobacteriota bacterium]